jgi:poly(hydroxyalkanoate) granule-associated protein
MTKKKTVSEEIKGSANKIWLAGLGALSLAEEEGDKLFKRLVSRGEDYQSGLKEPVEKATGKVKGTVKKVETMVDDQVTAALHRLGVPTKKEISELTDKVDRLTKTIEEMAARQTES